LGEELNQDTLNFSVGTRLSVETLGRNGVDFVDENDSRRVFSS
jgi:hypothetical protein